jgi:ABC-type sugar transport system substrate-binding protein
MLRRHRSTLYGTGSKGNWPRGVLAALMALALLGAACQDDNGGTATSTTGATTSPLPQLDENGPPFVAKFGWGDFQLNDRIAEKVRSGDTDFNFVMVAFATSAPFFTPIRLGLTDAAEQFGVNTELQGPSGFTVEDEVSTLESVLQTDVDGLIVQCPDPGLLVPLIDEAVGQGIPLLTFNSDCATSKRFANVGQDAVNAGQVAGQQFLQFFREGHPKGGGPYEVALISGAPTAQFAVDRFGGFQQIVGQETDIKFIGPLEGSFDPAEAFTAVENAFRGHPGIDGVFVPDESVLSAGEYVDRNGLNGEVTVVGFNLGAGIPELIQANAIQASIGQFPYDQGYRPVEMLFQFLSQGALPPCSVCDVGANIVSVDNVEDFIGSPEQAKEG